MKAVLLCLFLASAVLSQEGINTGQGLQALLFPVNGGGVELTTLNAVNRLSPNLPAAFSFESWLMLPYPPADGFYKTIVGRYEIGPDGTYSNRWADFDFQVQASGTLNILMGNGAPSMYGINLGTVNLAQGVWYHAAFSVSCCDGSANPLSVSVYLDLVQYSQNWLGGVRQYPSPSRNLFLGDYFNQDSDHKWWRGYMDEVKFWGNSKSASDFAVYMQRVPPYNLPGLIAYYRFNDADGLTLTDSTPNQYHGSLSKPTLTTSSPLWRVSGAKIYVDVSVPPLSTVSLTLPGLAPGGPLSFTYVIETFPTQTLNGLPLGSFIADGKYIQEVPFGLLGNSLIYEAGNLTGVTVGFSYYGTYNILDSTQREAQSTIVYVSVGGYQCNPDACGVCNGDNSTCSCFPIPYQGYSLNDVERILALYEIEQTLAALNTLDLKLAREQQDVAQHNGAELQTLINALTAFSTGCTTDFCQRIQDYSQGLQNLPSSS